MNDLLINKTTLTPQINFLTNGTLLIKGVSTPENTMNFYRPVFDWLRDFKASNKSKVTLILEIEYLNSTSTKAIVELLIVLNEMKAEGTPVDIMWRYDNGDEDMLDLGKDLEISSNSEVTYVPV
jgi:hypothetical protein